MTAVEEVLARRHPPKSHPERPPTSSSRGTLVFLRPATFAAIALCLVLFLSRSGNRPPMAAQVQALVPTSERALGLFDLKIVMTWNAPSDVDLEVEEPGGERYHIANTRGFGPETYTLPTAVSRPTSGISSGHFIITGKAVAGAMVNIYATQNPTNGYTFLASVTADGSGNFTHDDAAAASINPARRIYQVRYP